MKKLNQILSLFAALCLFVGWCVGSGFYGLPIASGASGFIPSITVSLFIALFTLPAALLYTEAILAFSDGVNIISLCKKTIGPMVALSVAILFFYLHYYYLASYFHDLALFIQQLLPEKIALSQTIIKLLLCFIMILTVALGLHTTNRVNIAFVIALLITLCFYTLLQMNHISKEFLSRMSWAFLFLSVPTYVGNYYYHSLLPTLSTYLQRNLRQICRTIFLGSAIFFLFVLLWQFLVLGTTSESTLWIANGGFDKSQQNIDLPQATESLTYIFHSLLFFSIFNTLLIGGFILSDVFFDGFSIPLIERKGIKRWAIASLIFIPPMLFSYFSDWVLYLDNFTGWGELFLIGPLPIWLVWNLRYTHQRSTTHIFPGGRFALFLYGILNFILFYVQAANFLWTSTI